MDLGTSIGSDAPAAPATASAGRTPDNKLFLSLFLQNQRRLYAYILTLLPNQADADVREIAAGPAEADGLRQLDDLVEIGRQRQRGEEEEEHVERLVDPEDDLGWSLELLVDLEASREVGRPCFQLVEIHAG